MPYPSVPKALADAFFEKFGAGSTRLDVDFQKNLPAIQVTRTGGYDENFTDFARIDVLVFAEDEDAAEELSEQIRDFLTTTRPIRGAGLLLDGAKTEVAPHRVPYADEVFCAFLGSYVVDSRRG